MLNFAVVFGINLPPRHHEFLKGTQW